MPRMPALRPNLHRHCDNHNTSHGPKTRILTGCCRFASLGIAPVPLQVKDAWLLRVPGVGIRPAGGPWRFGTVPTIFLIMPMPVNQFDYSVVVKLRAPPPNSWRLEIYRAGRSTPIKQASAWFDTVAASSRAGKEALKKQLDEFQSKNLRWPAA
jgi:hypothetical protein